VNEIRKSLTAVAYIHHLNYLRANLTTSTSLQPIRSINIQLHGPLHCRCSNLSSWI